MADQSGAVDQASRPSQNGSQPVANSYDLVIVGGGPAGLGVARGYREAGGQGSVLLLSAEGYAPYARPPLTKEYLRDETEADSLPLVPDSWYVENRIDLRLNAEATVIDRTTRLIGLSDGSEVSYQRLGLATGSSPTPLPVQGGDDPGLIYVRDRQSAELLREVAAAHRNVVVIGSGFIGCEVAVSLSRRDCAVVLVTDENLPHAARLGPDAGDRIRSWLEEEGVILALGDGVSSLDRVDGGWMIELQSGRRLGADAIVVGGGARPNLQLATDAGLVLENGGIRTDAEMRTSDPRIWAAGDITAAHHPTVDRRLRVEHWGEAETMGEIAGCNIAAEEGQVRRRRWDNAPGFWSAIGDRVLKYSAWGDGFDKAQLVEGPEGWAVWYLADDTVVGILSCAWDEAYDQGRELIERGAPASELWTVAGAGS